MRAIKSGKRYLLRLEKGEEIMEELKRFVSAERLPAAGLTGIGAVSRMKVGFYDPAAKDYRSRDHEGMIEVLSLTGNASWRDGEPVIHVHIAGVEITQGAMGGHVFSGTVSATMEIVVEPLEDRIERAVDEEVGLPLLDIPRFDRS